MLQQTFSSSVREDTPFQSSAQHTSAGEIRIFGLGQVSYENFIVVLIMIAGAAFVTKLVLKSHYHKKEKNALK